MTVHADEECEAHAHPESGTMPADRAIDATWDDEVASEAAARLRLLVDAMHELVVVHAEGSVLFVNRRVLSALGYARREELIGRPTASLVARGDLEGPRPGDDGTSAVHLLTKDGAIRVVEVTSVPLDFEGRRAFASFCLDVTERHASDVQRALHDRLAAFGTLATGVAHELNNPMTYVLANVEFVARRLRARGAERPLEEDESTAVEALARAVEGVQRMRRIVQGLMTFAQGSVEHRTVVDVRALVESSVQLAWHETRHRARLVKHLGEVPPVEANEARLGQVFLNLVVNAAHAIREGAANKNEVRVSTYLDPTGLVVVEVADTGAGIAPDVLPRIFDPFFTTKGAGEGVGLGLSIAHRVVRDLGGDIEVDSVLGKGSVFRVKLQPARGWRRTSLTDGTSVTRTAAPYERGRVLIVDDDQQVGDSIALILGDENDVRVVTSAEEALSLLVAGDRPDVILCDLMMPVMTGMELYGAVVQAAPAAARAFVFMTGGASTPRARAFLEWVGNLCVEKPIEAAELREIVRAHRRPASSMR